MKKFLKTLFMTLLILMFCMNTLINTASFLAISKISVTQDFIMDLQTYFNEINTERNKLLEEKVDLKIRTKIPVLETKPSYDYIKSMVVRIGHFKDKEALKAGIAGTGTGTIIKITEDYTYILTNKHVAPKDNSIIIVEKDLKRYTAEVVKNGVTRDLSLIRIVGKIKGTIAIKGLRKIKEQDKVYSIGMYLGDYNIYTEGTVAGWRDDSRLLNMPCLYGCSGSGVFDKDGYMVAVIYAGTRYTPFGAFDTAKAICVPYIGILTFLEEIL